MKERLRMETLAEGTAHLASLGLVLEPTAYLHRTRHGLEAFPRTPGLPSFRFGQAALQSMVETGRRAPTG